MKELEQEIKEYLEGRGWDNLRPSDVAKSISIEAGELLELFQWENRSLDEVRKDTKKIDEISDELPDVLIYCIELAVLLNMNVEEIIRRKLEEAKKKYPVELMRKMGDKAGTSRVYWKIKKQYRAKRLQKEANDT